MDKLTYEIVSDLFDAKFKNFTMKKDQTYYLIGENAIGKTTLLQKLTEHWTQNKDLDYKILYDVYISKNDLLSAYKNVNIEKTKLREKINSIAPIKQSNITNDDSFIENKKIDELNSFIENEIKSKNIKVINDLTLRKKELIDKIVSKVNDNRKSLLKKMSLKEYTLRDLLLNDKIDYFSSKRFLDQIGKKITHDIINRSIKDYFYQELRNDVRLFEIIENEILPIQSKENSDYLDIDNKIEELNKIDKKLKNFIYKKNNNEYLPSIDRLIWKVNLKMSKLQIFRDYEMTHNKNLSTGEKVIKWLKGIRDEHLKNNFVVGTAFDEPFNHLDNSSTKKAIDIINQIPGTKLIATHSSKALKYSNFENIILMWKNKKGKYCVANFSSLKKVKSDKKEIDTFISSILTETILDKTAINKKILIVEGYYDLVILKKYFPEKEYSIWPMGGVPYIHLGIYFAEKLSQKFRILMDQDYEGRKTEEKIKKRVKPSIFITKRIFGKNNTFLERLISQNTDSKEKIRKDIKKGKYDKRIEFIADKIKKTFNSATKTSPDRKRNKLSNG